VAENPVRNNHLPDNITAVTQLIVDRLKAGHVESLQQQLDYTLALVCSGRVSRECSLQIPLIDTLVDAGADPNAGVPPALPHGEIEALQHLLARGAILDLAIAIALDRVADISRLIAGAGKQELQTALAVAAFYGRADAVRQLISNGVDLDAFNPSGYHSHSTALHQAALAGHLDTVQVLVEAGADQGIRDHLWKATALEWAEYAYDQDRKKANADGESARLEATISWLQSH
jgi:peptide-methionine (S)-S-oxide reductase